MKKKSNYVVGVSLLIGVVLLAVLIGSVDARKLARTFGDLRVREALEATSAFFLAVIVLEGARVKVLFADYKLSLGTALNITLVGIFFGNFTPAMVGAEIYKAHFVRSLHTSFAKSLIRLFLLRIVGLAVTATGALWVMLFDKRFRRVLEDAVVSAFAVIHPTSVSVLGLGGAALLLWVLIGWARRSHCLPGLVVSVREITDFKQISSLQWLALVGLSVLVLCARAVFLTTAVQALSGTLGVEESVLAAAGSVLAGALPFSFGGLGVQESALAGILYALNVPESTAVAVALINRCLIWLAALGGGLIFLLSRTTRAASGRPGG